MSGDLELMQERLDEALRTLPWCGAFPGPNAIERLADKGIEFRSVDSFVWCLMSVQSSPDFKVSKQALEREERIASLSRDLAKLLNEPNPDDGWRVLIDHKRDYQAPEAVDLVDLVETLETLERTANQNIEQFHFAKSAGVLPGSGRSEKQRWFYWMTLLSHWRIAMGREIGTSTDGAGRPGGPLITFMEVMSEGMEERHSPASIQKFVQRCKTRVQKFAVEHMPSGAVQMRAFVDAGDMDV